MKRSWIAHPYLFTLASLIFVYPITAVIASPAQMLRPLCVMLVILLLLSLVVQRLVPERNWAAILLSVFVAGIYATPLFFYVAGIVSFAVIALWGLISFLRKRKFEIGQVSLLLNAVSVLLVVLSIVRSVPLFRQVSWTNYRNEMASLQEQLKVSPGAVESRPDIYYIVLDGYARSDVLEEFYLYDNSDFISDLEARGFVVPTGSRSNYPKTALSIASTLNMDYIPSVDLGIEDSVFWWLTSPLIDRSQTRQILEQAGYQTISIATDWSITDNPSADMYFKPAPVHINDFEGYLLSQTPLGGILKQGLRGIVDAPSFETHGQLVRFNFATLSEIPEYKKPTFTFAHIISPHPPFVFDKDGNPLNPDYSFSFNDANDFPGSEEEYRQSYLAQVAFVNLQLAEMIDTILDHSDAPPIIVIQADHGPGMLTDFQSSENTCLKERFSVFAAYYLPGEDAASVPDDITAVNVFRFIFNRYFEADLSFLENRFYYFKDTIYIFRAEDVTDQIDKACTILP